MTKREYTKSEVQELFEQAARMQEAPPPEPGYRVETVQRAAKEANISDSQLARAIHWLEFRRALRLGLVLVAVIAPLVIAALLWLPGTLGTRHQTVLLHNDNRDHAYTAEVRVPLADAARESDCGLSPEQRVAASTHCVARQIRLEPRARVRIKLPHRPSSCPHMDQKGLGSPDIHPAPEAALGVNTLRCPSTTEGGTA